jgi:hypothetical protein
MGSNHRRLSRRFYSPILLFKAYAADLRLCNPRRDLGRPPSAICPWAPGSGVRAVHRPWQNRPRTGADQPTDEYGRAHGRPRTSPRTGRKRPRTGPVGAVTPTAPIRVICPREHLRRSTSTYVVRGGFPGRRRPLRVATVLGHGRERQSHGRRCWERLRTPLPSPVPVRHVSVDPATRGPAPRHGDTPRDREKRPANHENAQPTESDRKGGGPRWYAPPSLSRLGSWHAQVWATSGQG